MGSIEKKVREPVGLVGRCQTQGTGYKSDGIMVLAVVAPVQSWKADYGVAYFEKKERQIYSGGHEYKRDHIAMQAPMDLDKLL